jgi:uncharacterized phage protein gp47/JayE
VTTLAPQIGPAGISGPSYADTFAQLQNMYWTVYGSDAVLDPSTQDGQFLAIVAQAIYDTGQACISVYNSFSPATALDAALSSRVGINGLTRNVAGYSTATVTLTGTAAAVIGNGIVGDNQNLGTQWALPATVTIGGGGTATVTATSTAAGNVSAGAGTLVNILTPMLGWQSVTNAAAAAVGLPVESDAALRQRQAASAGLPGLTQLEGIYAAVAALPGVGAPAVFENDTGITNALGLPPHSISAVVQGGAISAIAGAIALKKSPGTSTYGTTSQLVIDQNGVPVIVNFYQLATVTISVEVTVKALTGYVSTTATLIEQAVAAFISGLGIGGQVYLNRLYMPANLGGDNAVAATGYSQEQLDAFAATYNVSGIRIGTPALGTADIPLNFYQAAICVIANVTVIQT